MKYRGFNPFYPPSVSLPARGAWVEIDTPGLMDKVERRSPHGERGLKWATYGKRAYGSESLPARGAWVEIPNVAAVVPITESRSPHGERGLK